MHHFLPNFSKDLAKGEQFLEIGKQEIRAKLMSLPAEETVTRYTVYLAFIKKLILN